MVVPGRIIKHKTVLARHLDHLVNDGGISPPLTGYLREELLAIIGQLDLIIAEDKKNLEQRIADRQKALDTSS